MRWMVHLRSWAGRHFAAALRHLEQTWPPSSPRAVQAEALESRLFLSGVTVITHGYQQFSSTAPPWLGDMADAIVDRAGAATSVYSLRIESDGNDVPSVTDFRRLSGPTWASSQSNGEGVLLVDWAQASGVIFSYTSTAAIAQVIEPYLVGPQAGGRAFAELPIQLVGHSRGASVMSELARMLGQDGILVDQLTTLDPYPVFSDPAVTVTTNVNFADNYYQTNQWPGGAAITGAHNVNLTDVVASHTGIHSYYHGTIDTIATSVDGVTISPTWYGYDGTGPRDGVGFAWSRLGGEDRPSDGSALAGAARQSVAVTATGAAVWDNVIFLDHQDPISVVQGADFMATLGIDDGNRDATLIVGLDSDANPYNGVSTGQISPASLLPADSVLWQPVLATENVAPGTYYLYAAVGSDQRARYDYALGQITISQRPQVSVAATQRLAKEAGSGASRLGLFTVTRQGASIAEPLVVDYTVGGTAVSGTHYQSLSGAVTIPAGQSSAQISVAAINDSVIQEDPLTVVLTLSPDSEYRVGSSASATITIVDDDGRILQFAGKNKAVYQDADGDTVTVSVSGPGDGKVVLPGESGRADAQLIQLSGSTVGSFLTIAVAGVGRTTEIATIDVVGGLKGLNGKALDLTNALSVSGTLRSLTVHDLDGAAIHVGAPTTAGDALSIIANQVNDTSLDTATPVKALRAAAWLNTDPDRVIDAPWIGSVSMTGAGFRSSVELSGIGAPRGIALGQLSAPRGVVAGNWSITGNVRTITAGSIAELALSANAVQSVRVSLSFVDSTVTLLQPVVPGVKTIRSLTSLMVRGSLVDTDIRAAGSIGSVTVGAMTDSTIFGGMDQETVELPSSTTDFDAATATLDSFVVVGLGATNPSFTRSLIAAGRIGKVSLKVVSPQGTDPFGFATLLMGSYRRVGMVALPRNLTTSGNYDSVGNYRLRIV